MILRDTKSTNDCYRAYRCSVLVHSRRVARASLGFNGRNAREGDVSMVSASEARSCQTSKLDAERSVRSFAGQVFSKWRTRPHECLILSETRRGASLAWKAARWPSQMASWKSKKGKVNFNPQTRFRQTEKEASNFSLPPFSTMSSPAPAIIYSFVARGTTVLCENSGNFTGNFSQVRERGETREERR